MKRFLIILLLISGLIIISGCNDSEKQTVPNIETKAYR